LASDEDEKEHFFELLYANNKVSIYGCERYAPIVFSQRFQGHAVIPRRRRWLRNVVQGFLPALIMCCTACLLIPCAIALALLFARIVNVQLVVLDLRGLMRMHACMFVAGETRLGIVSIWVELSLSFAIPVSSVPMVFLSLYIIAAAV
jgi:hypothetical protein